MTFLSPTQPTSTTGAAGTLLSRLKAVMRITSDVFDDELNDLFSTAQAEMRRVGISATKSNDVDDPLIRQAIFTYVKARFGWDNDDADRLWAAWEIQLDGLRRNPLYTSGV